MNSTKSKIIRVALKMVSEKGYEWLSFQKVADEVGIAKSSIYHYFKKKEDLGIAIMELIEDKIQKKKEKILTYKSEQKKLNAYLTKANTEETLYYEVIAKLTFDFNGLPLNLQEKIKEHSIKTHEFVFKILKRGTEKKEFSITKDLEETTTGIILISIGGYIYGRVFDDIELNIGKYIINSITD